MRVGFFNKYSIVIIGTITFNTSFHNFFNLTSALASQQTFVSVDHLIQLEMIAKIINNFILNLSMLQIKKVDEGQKRSSNQTNESQYEAFGNEIYYNSLNHFRPICYNNKGVPSFLRNLQNDYIFKAIAFNSLCILLFLWILVLKDLYNNNRQPIFIISLILLGTANIFYWMILLVNPGIRNLAQITKAERDFIGQNYCNQCQSLKTVKMLHCSQCQLCISDRQFHCSFFNRCIVSKMVIPYYLFIFSLIGTFMLLFFSVIKAYNLD